MFILRTAEFSAVEAMKKFLDNEGHSIVGTLTDCYSLCLQNGLTASTIPTHFSPMVAILVSQV